MDGVHTSAVSSTINDDALRLLIDMEECTVERRALVRILASRQRSLA